MSQWGRKEYQSWPSRHPVWTLGAFFGTVWFFAAAVGVEYVRTWSFAEKFYLPIYAKTWVHGLFPKAQTRYQLIDVVNRKGQQRLAISGEVSQSCPAFGWGSPRCGSGL